MFIINAYCCHIVDRGDKCIAKVPQQTKTSVKELEMVILVDYGTNKTSSSRWILIVCLAPLLNYGMFRSPTCQISFDDEWRAVG